MPRPETIWRPSRCQWIYGEPRPDDACKCSRPVAEPGAAYCEHHARRAVDRRQATDSEAGKSDDS